MKLFRKALFEAQAGQKYVSLALGSAIRKVESLTVRKKTLLIAGITLTSLIGVLSATSSMILLSSIHKAEEQETRHIVNGVLNVLAQTRNDFSSRFADWSAWDDTYTFIETKNNHYINANLVPEQLAVLKVNLALFINPSGQTVFGTGFDLKNNKITPIPQGLKEHLSINDLLLHHSNTKSNRTGIILLAEGPMLITSQPIVTSKGSGPIRGTLIFGRYLDADAIETLARITRSSLVVYKFNDPQMPADFQAVRSALLGERQKSKAAGAITQCSMPNAQCPMPNAPPRTILVHPLSDRTIAGYALLRDIYSKPALLLRVDVPREIYQQGQKNLHYLIASLVVVGLIFGAIAQLLVEKLIKTEARNRAVLNAIPDLIIRIHRDGTYRDLKPAKDIDIHLPANEHIGKSIYHVLPHEMAAQRMHYVKLALETGEPQIYEYQVSLNGSTHYREARLVVCGEDEVLVLVRDITQRRQAENTIEYQAFHDLLTGLPNRAKFNQHLSLSLTNAHHSEKMMAVMFLDMDRFKTINDTLGHAVGDLLLQSFAERVKTCLREGDIVSRWGGDEFTVLLPQIHGVEDAKKIAQRILDVLKHPFHLEEQGASAATPPLHISSSIGIALYPQDGKDVQTLLRNADAALYRAKEQGRNNYRFYLPAMNSQASVLLTLESRMHQALERGEFVVYYQPQVHITTGRITGMEALVRWQHPEIGLVPPAQFIQLAEENGLIVPIGEWVLQTACEQNKAWQEAGFSPLRVAVNFSPRQFTQPNLVEKIAQVLSDTGLWPHCLELEITETTIMQNADFATDMLRDLRAMGVHITMDDFGTGYSSLSYLKKFPFQAIKIDHSFIWDLTTNPKDTAIISAVIALGRGLNLRVVAEGVKTNEELELLRSLECEEIQGNLFSKPLTATEATKFLKNHWMKNNFFYELMREGCLLDS